MVGRRGLLMPVGHYLRFVRLYGVEALVNYPEASRAWATSALLLTMPHELEARVTGDSVVKLESWASVWADLVHADMVLHARDQLPEQPENIFSRRALWESAVIAYGRTAKTGRRQVLLSDLLATLGPEAKDCHEKILKWRDKHVAHRQDPSRETVTTRAIFDPERRKITEVRIKVSPATGDEDGGELVSSFKEHIKVLRDLVWQRHFTALETRIIDENTERVDELLKTADTDRMPEAYFSYNISPSREPPTVQSKPNRAERRKRKKQ